ncbi:MAG: NAD(P)-dependent oxidoreductase [Paracoccaceae bacterium]|nr:NAD(P)-dependent oxidoreductase [Paracoccaceae bacterium]MDE2674233.1 NAD(P)-dependent oxidoreductase [Paracoccaceae bacterium]MXZ51020.1 NAD(P)-dependent oxidoreductase [Paracoccaceae bacterium]MYF47074.1 NAD(P)-dependent oxidoreductase [Paracoccaceae bacterium]MYI90688.1 NAD(P)-dependent oxidoreductase [Paracoccaceae bacterium]
MAKVAFVGLGVMGFPMAGHLKNAGHEVSVYNRTQEKADEWVRKYSGAKENTPREAALNKEFVFTCVGNDNDLREVCTGEDGIFAGMEKGSIFVDHTTVSAKVTSELRAILDPRGIGFIDAPVSGGQAGAENGLLSIMCGGNQDVFDRAEKVMACYAKVCKLMGTSGAGQLAKMVNQICIAGILQGLSEGMNFADRAGLDGRKVVEVISKGAAGSWQMENRYSTMIDGEFDFGFAVDWMRKDLGICLQTGDEIGASLPLTALIDQYYKDVQKLGGSRWDTSSLIQRLRKLDGKI